MLCIHNNNSSAALRLSDRLEVASLVQQVQETAADRVTRKTQHQQHHVNMVNQTA